MRVAVGSWFGDSQYRLESTRRFEFDGRAQRVAHGQPQQATPLSVIQLPSIHEQATCRSSQLIK